MRALLSSKSLRILVVALMLAVMTAVALRYRGAGARNLATPRAAPELTQRNASAWINSPPLKLADLRGKVVLVDFWAYGCWNCYRSFPWLKSLEARYAAQGLQVIGVHTPEFDHEKVRANVERKVEEFGLTHPVMLDNDYAYWKAIGNRYWPTFYLLDRRGRVRGYYIGETHPGDRNARALEEQLQRLLNEDPPEPAD